MPESGFYRDPLERHFARFYTGEGWAYRVRDADGKEWTFFDTDLTDERLRKMDAPIEDTLVEAIYFEIPRPVIEVDPNACSGASLEVESHSGAVLEYESGEWVKGFNSQARLRNDSVEISSFATKSRSALFLSSIQDVANAGTRIIPLRTIQAVHFHPAARGGMGTIQFTVPGSLTGQARNNSGKVLSLLGGDVRVQSHENSISFELSQQVNFEAFHSEIVERIGNLELSGPKTSPELSNHISQLRELKLLLDDGILTPDEFESAKQAILKKL